MKIDQLNREWISEHQMMYNITTSVHMEEKVLQIGEGNFLRGFIDWMIFKLNQEGKFQGKVVAVQPTKHGKVVPKLNQQDGLYTTVLRGIDQGKKVENIEIVDSINRGINPYVQWEEVLKVAESPNIQFVFSNTTEAGLSYKSETYDPSQSPDSFPGKLTALLYHRFKKLGEAPNSGWIIIPCELVDANGLLLKKLVIKTAENWNLPDHFIQWIQTENVFCNTLVDRIVTGYPRDQIEEYNEKLGYEDILLTTGEPYHLFVIDSHKDVKELLPFHEVGLNVHWDEIKPYRDLKVKLLNGPHTLMAAVGFLCGIETVKEAMEDELVGPFIQKSINEEIIPTFDDEKKAKDYANSVIERFINPFNKHMLKDIALNTVYKFKTRLLPTLKLYQEKFQYLPKHICFSFAAIFVYCKPSKQEKNEFIGSRFSEDYVIKDKVEILQLFSEVWSHYDGSNQSIQKLTAKVLSDKSIWDEDLNEIIDLNHMIATYINDILEFGMRDSLKKI
ncbi:tagaturonate reductase [Chengkuizengella sp. SCS-71B]|uniref:tagaturonate reductase n=1 Tax=Chengkuizengella sp. SCS-71B TaxID=3115290 RepID=UPI0032C2318C